MSEVTASRRRMSPKPSESCHERKTLRKICNPLPHECVYIFVATKFCLHSKFASSVPAECLTLAHGEDLDQVIKSDQSVNKNSKYHLGGLKKSTLSICES